MLGQSYVSYTRLILGLPKAQIWVKYTHKPSSQFRFISTRKPANPLLSSNNGLNSNTACEFRKELSYTINKSLIKHFSTSNSNFKPTSFNNEDGKESPKNDAKPKGPFADNSTGIPNQMLDAILVNFRTFLKTKLMERHKAEGNKKKITIDEELQEADNYFKSSNYRMQKELVIFRMYMFQFIFAFFLAYQFLKFISILFLHYFVDVSQYNEVAKSHVGKKYEDLISLLKGQHSELSDEAIEKVATKMVSLKYFVDSLFGPLILGSILLTRFFAHKMTIPISNRSLLFLLTRIKPNILQKGNVHQKNFIINYETYLNQSIKTGDPLFGVEARIKDAIRHNYSFDKELKRPIETVIKEQEKMANQGSIRKPHYYSGKPRPSLSPNIRRYLR